MDQIEAIKVYLRVADTASFTQAAQQLGLPKASVSTTVQRLEASLGTRLLHRTTRRVQMTADGQAYYERCRELLADAEELQAMFRAPSESVRGRLRVDVPLRFVSQVVLPRLPDFLRRHPELEIELGSTDRRVDLVREGYDCVVRIGELAESSLVARPAGALEQLNVASPGYLAAHGTPTHVDDLAGGAHRLVHYVPNLGGRSAGFEYVDRASGERRAIAMPGPITVNNSEAYVGAALAGLGLIQLPEIGASALVAQGRLVPILDAWRAPPMPVSLLYPNRRHLPRRVTLFMDWIAAALDEIRAEGATGAAGAAVGAATLPGPPTVEAVPSSTTPA